MWNLWITIQSLVRIIPSAHPLNQRKSPRKHLIPSTYWTFNIHPLLIHRHVPYLKLYVLRFWSISQQYTWEDWFKSRLKPWHDRLTSSTLTLIMPMSAAWTKTILSLDWMKCVWKKDESTATVLHWFLILINVEKT